MSSHLKLEGLDIQELGILLRKCLTNKEIDEKGLKHLIPTKNKKPRKKRKPENDGEWKFSQ